MPAQTTGSSLVRIVSGLQGTVTMRCELRLRFDYGSLPPWCEAIEDGRVMRVGPDVLVLRAPVPIQTRDECQTADFTVAAGRSLAFVLSYASADDPMPAALDPNEALAATQRDWRSWIRRQFERVLAVRNDVGLLAEEYDVASRRLSGNFPQALTHLAVVNTALVLSGPTLSRGGP